ncbi:GMP synthase (glutamine-hydrolyzing), partial [Pseudomonas sp. FW306-2-1A-C05A]
LSGGPASVHEAESPRVDDAVFGLGVPVLGICYGEQTMCDVLGGAVEPGQTREFGRAEIELVRETPLLEGLGALGHTETVWMSHG